MSIQDIKPFEQKIWLSSPTMHGEEQAFVKEAFDTNWVSTVGKNIDELERGICDYTGAKYAAGLDDYSTNRIELGFMFRIKAF